MAKERLGENIRSEQEKLRKLLAFHKLVEGCIQIIRVCRYIWELRFSFLKIKMFFNFCVGHRAIVVLVDSFFQLLDHIFSTVQNTHRDLKIGYIGVLCTFVFQQNNFKILTRHAFLRNSASMRLPLESQSHLAIIFSMETCLLTRPPKLEVAIKAARTNSVKTNNFIFRLLHSSRFCVILDRTK